VITGKRGKAEEFIRTLRDNPYQTPPPYEKLAGDLAGAYSRRINIQHRLIYQIIEDEKTVKIIRMWTHYE
jgi:Txe/YoeB family toxin of toxin-antitoxin system